MPKNPVRAARQAGREAVRAAKDTRKVAKIETKVAKKVAKISGTPVAKKATTYKPSAPTVKAPAPAAKPKINITDDMKGKVKDMPVATRKAAPAKKKPSAMEKQIDKMWADRGFTYGKDGKVRNAQGLTPAEAEEAERVRKNAQELVKKSQAKRETMNWIQKQQDRFKSSPSTPDFKKPTPADSSSKFQMGGKVDPYTTKPTATASMYKRSGSTLTKNADGTYSKGAIKKKGGTVKKSMYTKRK